MNFVADDNWDRGRHSAQRVGRGRDEQVHDLQECPWMPPSSAIHSAASASDDGRTTVVTCDDGVENASEFRLVPSW
jgi:hypothetical protein